MHAIRSLRSDQARAKAWSLRSDRALLKRRYDTSPCILVYPSTLSPEDHSKLSSCFPSSRDKRFESEDGPKGPKTRLEAHIAILTKGP
ncbi:hypothetical protein IGI04_040556 [Brassica rapa subsp. trilocularis]|uniref:Uncharacterized protein n=1 Tax=Brassica rapa subsp. trilocularis TaxID=1813537 RepID=A0ABQ7KN62_BRACM|nr:hypothetical protein IGI04_040556 [Brassica rapa subsp. trilocularis]